MLAFLSSDVALLRYLIVVTFANFSPSSHDVATKAPSDISAQLIVVERGASEWVRLHI